MVQVSFADLFKTIDPAQFELHFPDDEKALEYLAAEKWREGFVCRHCGHTNYCSGKTPHSRRCTRCKREESATAHTIFHRCKIPLVEALKIAYAVCHRPGVSTRELSRTIEIRQMTCWKFKKKIMECLAEQGRELTDAG